MQINPKYIEERKKKYRRNQWNPLRLIKLIKPLHRLFRKKKTQITDIKNERGDIIIESTDIKKDIHNISFI